MCVSDITTFYFFCRKKLKINKKRKEFFGKVLKFAVFCVTILTHAKVTLPKIVPKVKNALLRVLIVKKTNIIINDQNKEQG